MTKKQRIWTSRGTILSSAVLGTIGLVIATMNWTHERISAKRKVTRSFDVLLQIDNRPVPSKALWRRAIERVLPGSKVVNVGAPITSDQLESVLGQMYLEGRPPNVVVVASSKAGDALYLVLTSTVEEITVEVVGEQAHSETVLRLTKDLQETSQYKSLPVEGAAKSLLVAFSLYSNEGAQTIFEFCALACREVLGSDCEINIIL